MNLTNEELGMVAGGSSEIYNETADKIYDYYAECIRKRVSAEEFKREASIMVANTKGMTTQEHSDLLILIQMLSERLR